MPEPLTVRYEVVAIDWEPPNVLETFDSRAAADSYADGMDRLALRCFVRPRWPAASRVLGEQLRARVKEIGWTDKDADDLIRLATEAGRRANQIARKDDHA